MSSTVADLPLACTVRDCALPLVRVDRTYGCARGHSYDLARSGYLNLLQPQDRRSRTAGDSKASVGARASLIAADVGRAIVDGVVARAVALPLAPDAVVVDLGSGSGEVLGALAQGRLFRGIGIDLSSAAADHAARRFPGVMWVVANADRRLPLVDHRIDLMLSVNGRRNPDECARVLAPSGFLVVAVPAADDLVELREHVQGKRIERDRAGGVIADHASSFRLVERTSIRERKRLERDRLLDLLRGTYRGERLSAAPRLDALASLDVTLASDVLLFAPRKRRR